MFIEIVPNRTSPPAVLLRESWREGGKVRKRTLANLSKLPMPVVQGLRTLLKGGVAFADAGAAVSIRRALPHGDVSAVLGTLRDVGLERRLAGGKPDPAEGRLKDLAVAMIVARVIAPGSKLSTLRALSLETANSSLGLVLGLAGEDAPPIGTREIYAALDWLGDQQQRIENSLANKHLATTSSLRMCALVMCSILTLCSAASRCARSRIRSRSGSAKRTYSKIRTPLAFRNRVIPAV